MRHHTTDPSVRAEHIANRAERLREEALSLAGEFPYADWPRGWLRDYDASLQELIDLCREQDNTRANRPSQG